jgi:hypothetical protein
LIKKACTKFTGSGLDFGKLTTHNMCKVIKSISAKTLSIATFEADEAKINCIP